MPLASNDSDFSCKPLELKKLAKIEYKIEVFAARLRNFTTENHTNLPN